MIKVCKQCNEDFTTNHASTLYCSSRCKSRSSYIKELGIDVRTTKRMCEVCNKEFNPINSLQVFCGRKCKTKLYVSKLSDETKQKEKLRKSKFDKRRPNANQRGYNHKWNKFTKQYLEDNKLCIICGGKATEVDHIIPVKNSTQDFYDTSNLQSLCKSCHSSKTCKYDGGFKRTNVAI